jgi:hypothetical protein
MALKWFKCPDGEKIEIKRCLSTQGCRMGGRCAPLPVLWRSGYQRKWKGVSPSMAGNGPRLIYLQQTCDYSTSPEEMAFALLGTAAHKRLESFDDNVLSEERLVNGTPDLLEPDEYNKDQYILWDYKTWGSYKVAKALGWYKDVEEVMGDDGEPYRYKSGKRKGEIKTRNVLKQDPDKIDMKETELQINQYRIWFEAAGFKISRQKVYAIVRDGGTVAARSRMVTDRTYAFDVRFLKDQTVTDYYVTLAREVSRAFKDGYIRKCSKWENWDGLRCKSYCPVWDACEEMGG